MSSSLSDLEVKILGEMAEVANKNYSDEIQVGVVSVIFIYPDNNFSMNMVTHLPPEVAANLLHHAINNSIPIEKSMEDGVLIYVNSPKDTDGSGSGN